MDHEVLERIIDGRQKPADLPFALLKDITENFSDDREIGHGGFATVYRGVLRNGKTVAVKRIRSNHSINETLFRREVDTLLNIEHENMVRFLGFCASTNQIAVKIEGLKEHIYAEVRERLLCFEYISNGSLQKYITDELRGLEWNTRYEIIRGICEGLYHLHKEKQIYHMDMKPDNILLDNDMMPKITDFGLSRLDEKSQTMSEERLGSLGYCAPEYLRQGKMSFKSDMYSLGVIIVELVTGQKALPNKNNNVLRRWRHRWKKTGKETQLAHQQVAKCLEIGLLCQEIDPSKRPYIWQMIRDIRETDGPNKKNSNAYEQISPCTEDDMLGIEPLELHFPFELIKKMSCALWLTNGTDSYIAFNVENTSPLSYCTQPQKAIMPPQSKCKVDITLQLQGKAPGYMHRANELIVWSTKVNDCLAVEDITTNMFVIEAVNVVDEVNLDVGFDANELQEESRKSSEQESQDFTVCGSTPAATEPPDATLARGTASARRARDEGVLRKITVTSSPHSDGYQWRKYGQKNIMRTSFPRCYYRCCYHRERSCPATKLVQQQHSDDDQTMYQVIYVHEHTCHNTAPAEPEAAARSSTPDALGFSAGLSRQQRDGIVLNRGSKEPLACLLQGRRCYSGPEESSSQGRTGDGASAVSLDASDVGQDFMEYDVTDTLYSGMWASCDDGMLL